MVINTSRVTDHPIGDATRAAPLWAAPNASSPFVVIWMFAAIVLCLLLLASFSFELLSSVRAYVGGESLWSKAQKDAVFHLQKYAATGDPAQLQQYRQDIDVPLGDHEARLELNKPNPNLERVRADFIRGGNHPDDIGGMINLYRRFDWVSYMQRAIRTWEAGDRYIVQLGEAATLLQREIESPTPDAAKVQSILAVTSAINESLTPLENQFDDALSEASRATYRWLQTIMLAASPGLLLLGTALSLRILHQRRRVDDRTHHMAFHDELTSLPNRSMLNRRLEQALGRHRVAGSQLAVVYMDLDRFKVINDSLGHAVGDELLRQVAERLKTELRHGDMVARTGGDEFIAVIENHEDLADVSACAQRIIKRLSAPYRLGNEDCDITVSAGISIFPSDGLDSLALLKAADVALYRAKETGRSQGLRYAPSIHVHAVETPELESDLETRLGPG
jgi:diguanylate cyclase (GGDEF)-like protein